MSHLLDIKYTCRNSDVLCFKEFNEIWVKPVRDQTSSLKSVMCRKKHFEAGQGVSENSLQCSEKLQDAGKAQTKPIPGRKRNARTK